MDRGPTEGRKKVQLESWDDWESHSQEESSEHETLVLKQFKVMVRLKSDSA